MPENWVANLPEYAVIEVEPKDEPGRALYGQIFIKIGKEWTPARSAFTVLTDAEVIEHYNVLRLVSLPVPTAPPGGWH